MRRQHRRLPKDTELDITAFMNLMIVLVPVLLLNMVFAQTQILELHFPKPQANASLAQTLQLQVIIMQDKILVADSQGGIIRQIDDLPQAQGQSSHDFAQLSQVMQSIKARVPEKRDVTIMAEKQTAYQTLVTVMDTVRAFRTLVAGSLVNAELFPEISIADAPLQARES